VQRGHGQPTAEREARFSIKEQLGLLYRGDPHRAGHRGARQGGSLCHDGLLVGMNLEIETRSGGHGQLETKGQRLGRLKNSDRRFSRAAT
jgi:hypothetical protein